MDSSRHRIVLRTFRGACRRPNICVLERPSALISSGVLRKEVFVAWLPLRVQPLQAIEQIRARPFQ